MIDQAVTTLQGAGVEGRVGMVLADGGYGHSPQISQLGQDGIDAIVPTKAATRTKARKLSPRQGPEAERIDALLDTPEGHVPRVGVGRGRTEFRGVGDRVDAV